MRLHRLALIAALALAPHSNSTCGAQARTAMPEIVGHRGASHDAPENTLASVRLGWEQGADGVEVDIYLTADQRVVCLHDKDLKRTTGDPRAIADVTLADIAALDAGSWKSAQWAGEPIPMLANVLRTVPAGKRLFVEIKCGPEVTPHLVEHVGASGLEPAQVAFISFNAEACAAIKKALPAHEVYFLSGFKKDEAGVVKPTIDELIAKARELGVDGLDVSHKGPLDEQAVKAIKDAGLFLAVYTVNDADIAARLAAMGVDSITTDKPGELRAALAAPPKVSP